jgi:hypothetical protein
LNHTDFSGSVTACFPRGRDKTFLPHACFEIELDAPGRASGGPVFNANGDVIGVVSTSMSGTPPRTYATPIVPILDLSFDVQTDQGLRQLSLQDLHRLGIVSITGPNG